MVDAAKGVEVGWEDTLILWVWACSEAGVFTAGDFPATVLCPIAPRFGRGEAFDRFGVAVRGFLGVDAICERVGVAMFRWIRRCDGQKSQSVLSKQYICAR